jgi:hypothetical protein
MASGLSRVLSLGAGAAVLLAASVKVYSRIQSRANDGLPSAAA